MKVHFREPSGNVNAYASNANAPRKVKTNSNQTLRLSLATIDLLLPLSIAASSVSSFGLKPSLCFFHMAIRSSISMLRTHYSSQFFPYSVHTNTNVILCDANRLGNLVIGNLFQRHHYHRALNIG